MFFAVPSFSPRTQGQPAKQLQIFSIIPSEITNYGNSELFYNIPQQLLWNAVVLVDPD
jgi:hypothetical protein